ncbi:unnamed protein product [Gongylonema pulchrum]|uniref:PAM2 domain-containing protein n=1 Tax=Gongylonema pulchrum TaxID=637853 RepID=A0A183CZ30_9BILA|nr:unnamed protein product [Gongylonema pulchrum]
MNNIKVEISGEKERLPKLIMPVDENLEKPTVPGYQGVSGTNPTIGQPGPAGYGHVVDPNVPYYYGNMDPNVQVRPPPGPVGWPAPQGYPAPVASPQTVYHPGMRPGTPMRPPMPPQMMQVGAPIFT